MSAADGTFRWVREKVDGEGWVVAEVETDENGATLYLPGSDLTFDPYDFELGPFVVLPPELAELEPTSEGKP